MKRIFAVSDIHGEYTHLHSLFKNADIISSEGSWNWGDGHLVVDGDIFDRGDQVTECLWLLYRLEAEARKAGGDVHVLLGNHEMMIMRGDYRYVNKKYTNCIVAKSHMELAELYGPESVLGRWLRSKNSAVKLNDVLFVHGGISLDVVHRGYSIHEMNEEIRKGIDLSKQSLAADSSIYFLLRGDGPLWYRGFHVMDEGEPPECTPAQLDSILSYYGVSTVVVGHTEEPEVCAMYGGKVIALDVPTDELGSLQGMLWEEGEFFRVNGDGKRSILR
ncbi:MAG TPA: metallophosphoesterase [candidate division Zixibacteria bacterium]|nr:metallophosphoesterase [candidate division Zixibacteria bacterium]